MQDKWEQALKDECARQWSELNYVCLHGHHSDKWELARVKAQRDRLRGAYLEAENTAATAEAEEYDQNHHYPRVEERVREYIQKERDYLRRNLQPGDLTD